MLKDLIKAPYTDTELEYMIKDRFAKELNIKNFVEDINIPYAELLFYNSIARSPPFLFEIKKILSSRVRETRCVVKDARPYRLSCYIVNELKFCQPSDTLENFIQGQSLLISDIENYKYISLYEKSYKIFPTIEFDFSLPTKKTRKREVTMLNNQKLYDFSDYEFKLLSSIKKKINEEYQDELMVLDNGIVAVYETKTPSVQNLLDCLFREIKKHIKK